MEENEKFEKITALTEELGLSFDEMIAYWKAQGKLVAEQAQSSAPEKTSKAQQYQTPAKVIPGMFVYADGLISSEIIDGRLIKAIVGSVKGSEALAVCLQMESLRWSSDLLKAEITQRMTKGKEATLRILEIAHKTGKKAETAQWCYNYDRDGVKQG